jgi:hypothetical protein
MSCFKLFVVNEDSPDPRKWSCWSEPAIVIASDIDAARMMVNGLATGPACEIPMDRAVILMQKSEPNIGEDL